MKTKRILVTGAAGRIGSAFLESQHEDMELRIADLNVSTLAPTMGEVMQLDIADYGECLRACEDIDTVVHLAATALPDADFHDALLKPNIIGAHNIFLAAKERGCRRVVFASSAQAVEGYSADVQVHECMPPKPGNLYGVTKAFGEALAAYYSARFGLTTVCLRIANLAEFHAGENYSARDVAAFISKRDLISLILRSIRAELSGFNIVHGVSDNRYKRLSIDRTRRVLGYDPKDDGFLILEGRDIGS